MNTDKLNTTVKAAAGWKTTGIVKGVKIVGAIPRVGNGATHGINGDSYGFLITEVADDGTWFKYARGSNGGWGGKAWLCTRKNSPICGRYVMSDEFMAGYNENRKPSMNAHQAKWSLIYALDREGAPKTELDPSF